MPREARAAGAAVLGHEASATILVTGSQVEGLQDGDRVILLWNTPCSECFHCQRGEAHLCERAAARVNEPHADDAGGVPIHPGLTVGSFAEQTVLPAAAVVPVPDDITTADAALVGCAVTTGVGAVTKR